MKFAISIGTYELLSFAELCVLQCKRVFGGDVPILIYDGKSSASPLMKDIAAKHDCYYISESGNRGHFGGCCQNSVHALAFAQSMGADIAVKCNQRFIPMSTEIKRLVEMAFSNPEVMIALPGRPNPDGIVTSKFFSRFQFLNDIMFFRSGSISPEEFKSGYEYQCRTKQSHTDYFTEVFVANLIRNRFPKKYAVLEALTNHTPGRPNVYLRKIQNKRQDFVDAAMENGLSSFDFCVQEWKTMLGSNYKPFPVLQS